MVTLPATIEDLTRRTTADFAAVRDVRIGAEIEWLVFARDDHTRPVSAELTQTVAAGPLPAGGIVTVEPGGQLELITRPMPDPSALVAAIDLDAHVLARRFADQAMSLVPLGLDPIRPAVRSLDQPRYAAMESYFLAKSPAGVEMMNRTASLQLNIDFGTDPAMIWRLAHRLTPALAVMFANSPTMDGKSFRRVSHRQAIWAATDPSRTRPVGTEPASWHDFALDAQVMLRRKGASIEAQLEPLTFREWLLGTSPPDIDEMHLHLTTLFPPIRPRGFLELRMIDALPKVGRAAAIGIVWTLLTDRDAGQEAAAISASGDDLVTGWEALGLDDPAALATAGALFDLVAARLASEHPTIAAACEQWRTHITDHSVASSIEVLLEDAEAWTRPQGR